MLKRVDNFFLNTPDVARLAGYYSQSLGVPIRREQILTPGLMWMELNIGGMELSFRKAEGTPQEHPELAGDFLELRPGEGATVSFEVSDTDAVRSELSSRGVKFHGDVIPCTGGKELISIFEDPEGRPVQLYEGKFSSPEEAAVLAERISPAAPANGARAARVEVGANLRDIRNLAMSISFECADLGVTKAFYGDVLGLPLAEEAENELVFSLDGSVLQFRKKEALARDFTYRGGTVAIEVRSLQDAHGFLQRQGAMLSDAPESSCQVSKGRRNAFKDPEGNQVEVWERPA